MQSGSSCNPFWEIHVAYFRKRTNIGLPITLSVILMVLNISLMICWIVLLAQLYWWSALTIGTVLFVLILVGLTFYLIMTIKEMRLGQRQANFVDSVTHELKTPLAAIKLYLETLEMRNLEDDQRKEFYRVMESELKRLDLLINQLLEVGRLESIGEQDEPEDIELEPLLRHCAAAACAHHQQLEGNVFSYDIEPAVIHARPVVLEMIFRNLFDNAIKYGGEQPAVDVEVRVKPSGQVIARVADNGEGVRRDLRNKIFRMFYRGGNELERKKKGTGLGLYIVHTLVRKLKGKIKVQGREGTLGSVFEVELPGRALVCAS